MNIEQKTFQDMVAPDEIRVVSRKRQLNQKDVAVLVESIRTIGLQTPLTILLRETAQDGQWYELVAGHHRMQAAIELGIPLVPCIVLEDETDARLWEIAENLHRAELTALEHAEHVAEWVRITDERVAQIEPPLGGKQPKEQGIRKAVRDLGIDRNDAQRSVKIASLPDDAKQAAVDTGLQDNQAALLSAFRAPDPVVELRRLRAEKDAAAAAKRNRDADNAIKTTEAQQFAEWIMARTDVHEMPQVISWLEGCKFKQVIAALRREAQ